MDKITEPATDISMNSFAEVFCNGNKTATPVSTQGNFVKVQLSGAAFQMSMMGFSYSDGRLIYQGANGNFSINALALIAHDGQAEAREIRLTVFKNGAAIGQTYGKVSTPALFKPVSFALEIALAGGDYLEVMVANAGGTESIIVQNLKLSVINKQ